MIDFLVSLWAYLLYRREKEMENVRVSDLSKHHLITLDCPSGRIIARVQTIVDSLERCLRASKEER